MNKVDFHRPKPKLWPLMERHRKRYKLPLTVKMLLLYLAVIGTVLPTNSANVDASNSNAGAEGYLTFSVPESAFSVNASPTIKEDIKADMGLSATAAPTAPSAGASAAVAKTSAPAPSKAKNASRIKPVDSKQKYVFWKTVRAKVTAYTPDAISCGVHANGKTSIGKNAWRMVGVAADATAAPYGTMVNIPGVGMRVVDDTGSGMRKSWRKKGVYHFDLRMTYNYQCRKWGIKWLDVDLYRPVK